MFQLKVYTASKVEYILCFFRLEYLALLHLAFLLKTSQDQCLALLVEYFFLTSFYGLYFNHQLLHITLYNFLKFLQILVEEGLEIEGICELLAVLQFWYMGYEQLK